jgi:hypothetical protein
MDVMLTLAANQALSDGVAPDRQRTRGEFPYFGEPYTHDEQHGVPPAAQRPVDYVLDDVSSLSC